MWVALVPSFAHAQCTSPAATEATIEYFTGDSAYKLCTGTVWETIVLSDVLGACTNNKARDYDATEQAYALCDGTNWRKIACANGGSCSEEKETASDGAADDRFGEAVSVSGDIAVIGAARDDDNGSDSGSAYVFEHAGSNWNQVAKLTASDGASGDRFGTSVSLDGGRALIGAPEDNSDNGSAYVFDRSGTSWNQAAKITFSGGGGVNFRFGTSVSLDGDRALIGAPNSNSPPDSGSAYILERSGTSWNQVENLTASDGSGGDIFGTSVSLDGDRALIGAPEDNSGSGSAYVFDRSGTSWNQVAKLTASDGAANDRFGESVSVSGDIAVIGARDDDDNGSRSGSAYVFERDGGGNWAQTAKLTASDSAAHDFFGDSVSVSGDIAVIGALGNNDDGSDSGSAYVFERGGGGNWSQTVKLTASDGAAGDFFGRAVSVSGDIGVIGAPLDDDNGSSSGSAYFYNLDIRTCTQQAGTLDYNTTDHAYEWCDGTNLKQFKTVP